MRAFILTLITLIFIPFAAVSQSADRPNTILVLDGSGSMWGQIDGVNKIVIARNVIGDMLAEMADDVSLGLTVYGHRERGSCGDIETIVEPAPFTQDRILEAVNSINPRGRTPMTDAVIAAAQSLRHTEEAATVILVSDGIENCNPDPCAIATELEQSGVAFTAHVIGFDVASEPEARAQMQCIADNTGGLFLTADNAAELSQALETVVEVAATPTQMRIEAQILPEGTYPTRPITWTLLDGAGNVLSAGVQSPAIDVGLMPGSYVAQATRDEPEGPRTYQTAFSVVQDQTDLIVVGMPAIVETSQITFSARVMPDGTTPSSQLNWTLFDASGNALFGPLQAPGGNVALLPGDYRLQVERVSQGTMHEARFTVQPSTPQQVVIDLPAIAVEVTFVARIGDIGGLPITDPVVWDVEPLMSNPATSNPATFLMPRGAYRVTAYWTAQEIEVTQDFVVVDQPREIVVVFPAPQPRASITTVASGVAGSLIEFGWNGPGADRDWIGFYPPENRTNHNYDAITRVDLRNLDGATGELRLPPTPGIYELRYISSENNRQVLSSATVEVLPVPASVDVTTGVAGSIAQVTWSGPSYPGDWLGFYPVDDRTSHSYDALTRMEIADETNPTRDLRYPARPGTYELRYVMNQDRTVIARQTVEVTPVAASLTVPETGVAGAEFQVGWTGPAYPRDWIGFYAVDDRTNHSYDAFTRVEVEADRPNLPLRYPSEPGTYELRYVMSQDRVTIAMATIEVSDIGATLTTPARGVAGALAEVGWSGPANPRDWIGFYPVENRSNHAYEAISRVEVAADTPVAELRYPPEPGTYELRYVMAQDRRVIGRQTIEVLPVGASLTVAPGTAGAEAEVGWTGPANPRDWIGFYPVENRSNHSYEAISRVEVIAGESLARLRYPPEPGTYELRYVMNQGRTVLASETVEVQPVTATLTVAETAVAGSMAEVGWTGPANPRDWIGFYAPDDRTSHSYDAVSRVEVERGVPTAQLRFPPRAGTYELRYVMAQGRTVLARATIVITPAQASLIVPDRLDAATEVSFGWTGPAYPRDWIGIYATDDRTSHGYDAFVRAEVDANTPDITLRLPAEPGTYELRYVMNQGREVIARETIVVTESEASVTAPTNAPAGSVIEVVWSAPATGRDFIGIGRVGAEGSARWENYVRASDGNPAELLLPAAPGTYQISFFESAGNTPLASTQIEVTDVAASITAPATSVAGSTIDVGWTGPGYPRDFIGVGLVGAEGSARWDNYIAVDQGNPLRLQTPPRAGTYEITYFIDQDRRDIATAVIELSPPAASLTLPSTAVAGSTIDVGWTGPGYPRDFIGIGLVGAEGSAHWDNYIAVDQGNPVRLLTPPRPGTYEVTYFIDQDRVDVETVTLDLTEIPATLSAPASAEAGSVVDVAWTGPNYDGDFIAIGRAGADGSARWESYSDTEAGSPAALTMPDSPGAYVIRYFVDQDRVVIAETPITVN
ncbi:VWA domain-containing protein [Gymnodinialimonas sp. 2305UL16-5]|uniref:VWA domain-containing protein n=1 Tax=Gymnodinialimonas mytili TaxID=3126503 RepID=UPI0030A76EA9